MGIKKLVISNKDNTAVRVLNVSGDTLIVAKNLRTKRIVFVDSLETLKKETDEFEIINKLKLNQLEKKSLPISSDYQLQLVKSDFNTQKEFIIPVQDSKESQNALKWTVGLHSFIGSLILLGVIFVNPSNRQTKSSDDIHIVKIDRALLDATQSDSIKPAELIKNSLNESPKTKLKIDIKTKVSAREVPVANQVKKSKQLLRTAKISVKPTTKRLAKSNISINKPKVFRKHVGGGYLNEPRGGGGFGALAVLGQTVKGPSGVAGGMAMNAELSRKNRGGGYGRGIGIGRGNGTSGRGHDRGGGVASALYGKGLIAALPGRGESGFGSGVGLGTKGMGGFGNSSGGGVSKYTPRNFTKEAGKLANGFAGGDGDGFGIGNGRGNGRGGEIGVSDGPATDDFEISAGLSRDQVSAVISRNIGQVVYCYEMGLQKQAHLRGRVQVEFKISPNGYVNQANIVTSSLKSSIVESCVQKKILGWKFPKPIGGVYVDVSYPFMLQRVAQN